MPTTRVDLPGKSKGSTGSGVLSTIVEIASSLFSGAALSSSGGVYTWGTKWTNTTTDTILPYPEPVSGLSKIAALGRALRVHYAINETGRLFDWGRGRWGELGRRIDNSVGNTARGPRASWHRATVRSNIVSGGWRLRLRLCRDVGGNLYSWGLNNDGQLGTGTTGLTNDRNVPVPVQQGDGTLSGVRSAAAPSDIFPFIWHGHYSGDTSRRIRWHKRRRWHKRHRNSSQVSKQPAVRQLGVVSVVGSPTACPRRHPRAPTPSAPWP